MSEASHYCPKCGNVNPPPLEYMTDNIIDAMPLDLLQQVSQVTGLPLIDDVGFNKTLEGVWGLCTLCLCEAIVEVIKTERTIQILGR